jgi:hypothetical protein
MSKDEEDFINFDGERIRINYITYANPVSFARHIWLVGMDIIKRRHKGADIYVVGEKAKYLTLFGPPGKKGEADGSTWAFKLVELRMTEAEGGPFPALKELTRVPEKFAAPVFFLDEKLSETGGKDIITTVFRPSDLKHYELTTIGVVIQTGIRNIIDGILAANRAAKKS